MQPFTRLTDEELERAAALFERARCRCRLCGATMTERAGFAQFVEHVVAYHGLGVRSRPLFPSPPFDPVHRGVVAAARYLSLPGDSLGRFFPDEDPSSLRGSVPAARSAHTAQDKAQFLAPLPVLVLLAGLLLCGPTRLLQAAPDWTRVEQTLIAEAASEGYQGMYAVGCVMRNRGWNLRPFVASRRHDLTGFVLRQPAAVRRDAADALVRLRAGGPDVTHGATHYENLEAFGLPRWAKGMTITARIGRHTFFREGD